MFTRKTATCAAFAASLGWLSVATARAADLHDPVAAGELPQYIFFNKAPGARPLPWNQLYPDHFTPESVEDIIKTVGTRGNARLRIGVSFPFSILERDVETTAKCIERMLAACEKVDVPVLVAIDGQNWWQTRGDLWNWWDPARPGYDPANRNNVEWTGWGPEHAVKIGWRNWGKQFRIAPAPNLASPQFLAEHWKAYDIILPIVLRWYRQLPPDKRYLFGGVKVGWEASINVNAFLYRDADRILEQHPHDASADPNDHDPRHGWTFGQAALGYAAVTTAGIKKSGTLTKEDLERVVYQYLERMAAEAHKRGVPRHLIFTHQGGTFAPWDQHLNFKPAINEFSIPGWSFYSHDPADSGSLAAELEAAGRQQWAAVEWWRGADSAQHWRERFEACLRFKQCRFVSVFGWGQFRKLPEAHAAIRELVARAATRPALE